MDALKRQLKDIVRNAAKPIGRALAAVGIRADWVTVLGVVWAVPAAHAFYQGHYRRAFLFLLLSGLCDLLDGAVARSMGSGTKFGAALDSTLDRYGEGLVLGGITLGLAARGAPYWLLAVAVLVGVGSFLVSYVRARAEGLDIPCEVGILERPERLILLLILGLWGEAGAPWILGTLAVLTHVTFLQRLAVVKRGSQALPAPRSKEPVA